MLRPRMLFEKNQKYPGEVVVMVSLVPSFEPKQPQELNVLEDEDPVGTSFYKSQDFLYVFVVDRSGSMEGNRMEITK